jgi:hypothetical protein
MRSKQYKVASFPGRSLPTRPALDVIGLCLFLFTTLHEDHHHSVASVCPEIQPWPPAFRLHFVRRRRRQANLVHQSCISLAGQLKNTLVPLLDAASCVTWRRDRHLPPKKLHNRMRACPRRMPRPGIPVGMRNRAEYRFMVCILIGERRS